MLQNSEISPIVSYILFKLIEYFKFQLEKFITTINLLKITSIKIVIRNSSLFHFH